MFETKAWFLLLQLCFFAFAFEEEFGNGWTERWVHSQDEKYNGIFKTDQLDPDIALMNSGKAQHYGLTAVLAEPVDPSEGLILQFEAKYSQGQTCSGAYLKFYSKRDNFDPKELTPDTPYTVMFGPDVCGPTSKVHLILNHKSPKTGEVSEKHLKKPPRVKSDKLTHVYTAILRTNNTYEVMVDGNVAVQGDLFEDFDPPINPPEEIPDPEDKKPDDWVGLKLIDDPNAFKPDDWVDEAFIEDMDVQKPEGWLDDVPNMIPDESAIKPEEWDDEEDGEWSPPLIKNPTCKSAPGCGEWKRPLKANPKYKGPWKPPKIDNPEYKGEWKPKMIPNPDYCIDETPLKSLHPIGALGFELWVMDNGIYFDNIVVTQDMDVARRYIDKWRERNEIEEAKIQEAKVKEAIAKLAFPRNLLVQLPESVQQHLEPAVEYLEKQGQSFYATVAMIGILVFAILLRRCVSGRKRVGDARRSKKRDVSGPDDKTESDTAAAGSETDRQSAATENNTAGNDPEDETPRQGGMRHRRSN